MATNPISSPRQGVTDSVYYFDPSVKQDIELDSSVAQSQQSGDGSSIVTSLILSSALYKEAYSILSSDKKYGTSYLSMLQMIPYGVSVRDENFWDEVSNFFGATSGFEEAVTDAFNGALDEIRSLMQEYYSFLSKLPVEQVDQLRDAGVNASVTGEGLTPSSMSSPDPASMISPNTPQSEYRNTSLSDGVTSFVEFIGSMAGLASLGVNSANILGLLDVAERESYSKQETHDLLLAGLGVTTDSPYRILNPGNTPVVSTLASTAQSEQRVKSAEAGAAAKALDAPISVNVGDDPNSVAHYEIKTGEDWLAECSRFQIANRFGNIMIQNLRNQGQQMYAGVLSYLEGEYNMSNFSSMTEQARFNSDYFRARNGSLEGQNQTDLTTSLSEIRRCESYIRSVESWMADYRAGIIDHWGQQLEKRPNLAPYFYKALFDFNMEDTFYHQNGAAQGLKYGLKSLESIGSFLGNITGFKRPVLQPRKVGQTTHSSGPNGDTITDTIYHFD